MLTRYSGHFPNTLFFVGHILFCALALVLLLGANAIAAESKDYRKEGIVVTGSYSWKPYTFTGPNGEPSGFFIDFWKRWSHKTGVPVSFRLVSWNESLELVASGECDMQSGMFYTEDRSKIFDFSDPTYFTKSVVASNNHVSCNDDRSSFLWGGVKGTAESSYAKKLASNGKVIDYKDSIRLLDALAANKVQLAVDDWSTVMLLGRELGIHRDIQICETIYENDLQSAVRKGNTELLALVNEGIAQISDKELQTLVNRWFVSPRDPFDWVKRYLPFMILVIIGVGALLIYSSRRQR